MTREQFIAGVQGTQEVFRRFLVALCCGDGQLADDVAQEAYLKAYMASDSLASPEKFRSWIFSIGYRCFLNNKRAFKEYSGYDDMAANCDSGDSSDNTFRYQALYNALNRLSPTERNSVLLYYMQGYSVSEIAGMENVSPEAVRQHLSRGRQHLRGLLIDE